MIDVFEPSGSAWHFTLNEYSRICSPTFDSTISHSTGNALSTFTPSLAVTPFIKPFRDVLGAHGFHCFRSSSSLHVYFISHVLLVLPTSLYYSLDLNCTTVNVCWLRFTRKHAGIPNKQTSLWTSFIPLSLVSPHRLLELLPWEHIQWWYLLTAHTSTWPLLLITWFPFFKDIVYISH